MPNWTKEQQDAIYKSGSNIIVSAGAGSGKTAVLTERVIQKLKQGIHINELLILTFTKAAAAEMRERIRVAIESDESLIPELDLIDTAYITTFDSYALSIVKKYHYLLNVPKDIKIISSVLMEDYKKNLLDDIFEELYKRQDHSFCQLIDTFCVKDDNNLKKLLYPILNKLELIIDLDSYLENYLSNYFNREYLDSLINEFTNLIMLKRDELTSLCHELSFLVDGKYMSKLEDSLSNFLNNPIILGKMDDIKLPVLPRGSEDNVKHIKEKINSVIKDIKGLYDYGTEDEIRLSLKNSMDFVKPLINIFKIYMDRLKQYKRDHDYYEFTDIANLAIKILQKEDISLELKKTFKEILVDEYQDTNDVQDTFLKLIENNNIYMVGDIKQSIYRFRNANPNLFQTKYDLYSKKSGGIKIDLIRNFRSRKEVLNNINDIFNLIMDLDLGGADYSLSHQMVFGNSVYEESKANQDYQMLMLEYPNVNDSKYSKEELEAFIIARDIKKRIANHEQVIDKKTSKLRDIEYRDCAILMDRTTSFSLYKKIFDYLEVPLSVYKDETLNENIDLYLIHNLLEIINKISKQEFDNRFRYDFISIARSYLFTWNDEDIFNCFASNDFYHNDIYDLLSSLSLFFHSMTPFDMLELIIDKCHLYEKLITLGNVSNRLIQIEKILDTARELSNLGYNIEMFIDYINKALTENYAIKYTVEVSGNSVQIMTIHKSKGLEFPICYYSGLTKKFNIREINEKIFYHNKYGLITPYFDEGIRSTIIKELVKNDYLINEISEKIRLFYVALTRAKEKMIFVLPEDNQDNDYIKDKVSYAKRIKYRSFYDILTSIKHNLEHYYQQISMDNINPTKEYLYPKKMVDMSLEKHESDLVVEELDINVLENSKKNYSKKTNFLYTQEEYDKTKIGSLLHEILEVIDLKNPNWELLKTYPYYREIKAFLNQSLFKNINDANIYHEYAFMNQADLVESGIIDLMIEYSDHIDIIDYKLKDIQDEHYIEQLKGYKEYINEIINKPVHLYLYSIMDHQFLPII